MAEAKLSLDSMHCSDRLNLISMSIPFSDFDQSQLGKMARKTLLLKSHCPIKDESRKNGDFETITLRHIMNTCASMSHFSVNLKQYPNPF
jgi:hypothetical protein